MGNEYHFVEFARFGRFGNSLENVIHLPPVVSCHRFEETSVNVPDLLTRPEALRAHIRAALAGRGGARKPPPQGLRQAAVLLMVVVGTIPYPYPLRVSPAEVRAVIEAPLRVLLDPANVRTEIWTRGGVPREIYFYSVGAEVVWGATGRVITQFLEAVFNVQ